MLDSIHIVDIFLRGLAVGAMLLLALNSLRASVGRDQRIGLCLAGLCVICWLITESQTLWPALGRVYVLLIPSFAVGAAFWLLIMTLFEDRPLRPLWLAPAALEVVLGLATGAPQPVGDLAWYAMNGLAGVLELHALFIIARGWNGDLIEGRRRLRGPLLGLSALYAISVVVFGFAARADPHGPWMQFTAGRPLGGAFISLVIVATAASFLQVRTALFGAARRGPAPADLRAEAAERQLLEKLNALMAGEGWRREGLTIGAMSRELSEPEHRLRRLINQRLGHRNFADFVNSYRIEAAKRRLADPAEARTTVAAIAFDLGYGSLGPFNRAFRASTGATPTEWRRRALAASPDLQDAV